MSRRIKLRVATPEDVPAILSLNAAVNTDLTERYGKGPWSSFSSEKGVLYRMRIATIYLATRRNRPLAKLNLSRRKPWAIDIRYFSASTSPLYLTGMAVAPDQQRQGIGRLCIEEARRIGRTWPADAIRLDAWDADAGAGEFYRKCGFREVGRVTYRNTPLIYFEMPL